MRNIYKDKTKSLKGITGISVYVGGNSDLAANYCWGWQMFGENTNNEGEMLKDFSDSMPKCGCENNNEHEREISEILSACHALEWLKDRNLRLPVDVFGFTDLLDEAELKPDVFDGKIGNSECDPLKASGKQLRRLLDELKVKIIQISYKNRDILLGYILSKG